MNYVVDASVAIKWYIPEIHSAKAVTYLSLARDRETVLMAPDLILTELGNVLWKKLRQQLLSLDDVRIITQALSGSFPAILIESRIILPSALEIASAAGLTINDSLCLALAAVEGAVLITADKKLASIGEGLVGLVNVELLA